MIHPLSSKACTNCAKARRKCGKQRPQCLRCQTRGRTCQYPPSRPSAFVPLASQPPSPTLPPSNSQNPNSISLDLLPSTALVCTQPSPLTLHFPIFSAYTSSLWFASPETWAIDVSPTQSLCSTPRFTSTDFDRILRKVLGWLTQWIETGSCPFIHRQLYRKCFPDEISGAYLALGAWLHRSDGNRQIVYRVIEERVTRLVENGLLLDLPVNNRDAVLNLSRVQALLVYQCIGLYDGNVRLRHLAEKHIPVVESWVVVLMEQTSQLTSSATPPHAADEENMLWYSWIVAESARRVWLIISGVQGLYRIFTNPDPTNPCIGGTVFTSRRGFWEAPSAKAWERACTERYAGLVRLTETEKMFAMVPKEEISEFAKVVLECKFGLEWCEEWLEG